MKKIALLFVICCLPLSYVEGSYSESCDVKAKVLKFLRQKEGYDLKIKVLSYKMLDGSHGDQHCKEKANQTLNVKVKEIKQIPKIGSTIELIYSYSDGMGPGRVVVTERWRFK